MAKQLQLRKGTATEHNSFTGAVGEVTVDTTNKTLRVHDGSTIGGTRLATLTGGLVPVSQLPDATTSTQGAVKLNNTLTSTSVTEALTAAQGKVLKDTINANSLGVGQSWQNMTASRAIGVTYTNSTGKPIFIFVELVNIYENVSAEFGILLINSVEIPFTGGGYNTYNTRKSANISVIIPNSATYKLTSQSGGAIANWSELR